MRAGVGCILVLCLVSSSAFAQRADDNAIADAEDAFGSNDGGEDLGLYGPFDVRGFSPIDAGNVRVEGIFIDRQADLNPRLIEGNRIRVGPSAATYAFPAPSGIVDYRLRTPGMEAAISAVAQVNSFGGALVDVDASLPVRPDLSVGVGVSQNHSEYASGNNADISHLAAIAHWRPAAATEAKLFWSRTRIVDEDIFPIVIGNGSSVPTRIKRRRFLGQHWADVETERFNYGVIAKTNLAGFVVRGGVFRSVNEVLEGHNIFLQAGPLGQVSTRTASAFPGRRAASTSGELGLAREFATGALRHRLQLIARGRAQDRRFGGTQRLRLSDAPFGTPAFIQRPVFSFSPQSRDEVRQWSFGIGYQAEHETLGQISAGLQKVDYKKAVSAPSGALPTSRDKPWLLNVAAVANVATGVALFGSYTRGLEESDVAPEIAINRDEAPPALRTKQLDAGLRAKLGGVTIIAGAFDIRRPYYGVDAANVFRRLGAVGHKGAEISVAGTPAPGLTVVAGGTFLRARVSGEEVASGTIGRRPVDVPSRKLIGNLDWRPIGSATSFDVAVEHVGLNVGDALNLVKVSPITTIDLGLRHRFKLGEGNAVLRLQATNVLNEYGWEVAGNNAFIYVQSRQVLARLAVDF
jgi:iron complex outermembrane receptor protein